jgi:hypothetical protein
MQERWMGKGASMGKEAVLAGSGRAGEVSAGVVRVRRATFSASCQGMSSRMVDWIDGNGAVWRGGPGMTSPEPLWLAPWMSPIESCGPSVVRAPLHA